MPSPRSGLATRALSAFLFAIAIGTGLHHRYHVEQLQGKDAFLANRAAFYDHSLAHPHSLPVYVLEWVIYVALLWSLFEGLSWLFAALFAAVSKDTSSTPGGKLL